ncbi:hypothetical protein Poly24_14810 [Rosistilla carotiformis]|uniref:Uncharacterized protein n=1 Tax=Rosistilla carotiformis TaxID=2528017 RepID=A0A518JQF7_9BACT|nr:hypothetical protein [Rosistilla carotiformis]QDV67777.1 hypothetical protein Poly24_14810 [Rosistilla carotiformis]
MWHTSTGDRTLSGAEATLIVQTCVTMIDALEWEVRNDNDAVVCESGVELYDDQLVCQRIALLNEVCHGLLSPNQAMPELTAELEATVMAIFETVKSHIELEIDAGHCFGDSCCDIRSMVLAAYGDNAPGSDSESSSIDEDLDDIPDPWCDEIDQWDLVVELLADRILWDRDFEMASMIVDEEPEMAEAYKQVLGIDNDYFSMAPPEVNESDAPSCLYNLRAFLNQSALPRRPR